MDTTDSTRASARDASPFIEDAWYVLCESRAVRGRPVSLTRLGRRIVLWRDTEGTLHAHGAHCPHRGVDLGLGRVVDGCLECPYHGLRFTPEGRCVSVPCDGRERRIRPDLTLASLPTREAHGLVWLWWGSPRETYPELPWFESLPGDTRHACTRTMEWAVPFSRAVEGNLDLHHVPFAHRRVMPGAGTLLDPYEVHVDGEHIRSRAVLRHDDGQPYSGKGGFAAELSVRFPGTVHLRFGARVQLLAALTPVDPARTFILFRYYIALPFVGRLAAWLAAFLELRLVQPDDERLLASSLRLGAEAGEDKLVRADAAIGHWHRLYRQRCAAARERSTQLTG